ncbi:MAG: NUDIX hydrolase [Anaerolineae bacterium]|jgi:ADP-ribose pyrophosphatase|nr:NUDIX hydrolase [Anaerolineae bacterium]
MTAQDAKLLHAGRYLHFYRHPGGWEYVRRPAAVEGVTIIAATPERKLLLVEQYRVPLGAPCIELPAGLVGDTAAGDSPLAAARRELEEETGYTCDEVVSIGTGTWLPGVTDELNTLCWTKGLHGPVDPTGADEVYSLSGVRGIAEEGEALRVYAVPLTTAEVWLANQIAVGKVVDLKVYLGILYLQRELGCVSESGR